MGKGVFIVSIDTELIWGFNHLLFFKEYRSYVEKISGIISGRSRRNVKKLLQLSEKYDIPFTWAVVGHLALDSCECVNGVAHPDMPRPEGFKAGDWYAHDPCSNYREAPLWYAPDIVEELASSQVPQDIGCHSFSHVNFQEASRKVAEAEVRKCKEVLAGYGVTPVSFVFPRNRVAHVDVLAQEGFKIYRFKAGRELKLPRFLRRKVVYKLYDAISPITGEPRVDEGVVAVPGTLLFQTPRRWEVPILVEAARRGLRIVGEKGGVFHLTMHDYLESDLLLKGLESILRVARELRVRGVLETASMADLVKYYI